VVGTPLRRAAPRFGTCGTAGGWSPPPTPHTHTVPAEAALLMDALAVNEDVIGTLIARLQDDDVRALRATCRALFTAGASS
jgi:hypothetical protein